MREREYINVEALAQLRLIEHALRDIHPVAVSENEMIQVCSVVRAWVQRLERMVEVTEQP